VCVWECVVCVCESLITQSCMRELTLTEICVNSVEATGREQQQAKGQSIREKRGESIVDHVHSSWTSLTNELIEVRVRKRLLVKSFRDLPQLVHATDCREKLRRRLGRVVRCSQNIQRDRRASTERTQRLRGAGRCGLCLRSEACCCCCVKRLSLVHNLQQK
jgi:hypothetical protein